MQNKNNNRLMRNAVLSVFSAGMLTAGVTSVAFANHYYGGWERDRDDDERKIVIMHTGDLHGDLRAHPNARADATGQLEGGLARAATVIKRLKRKYGDKLVWGHTGDTIQGSAIATYTQGKALVDVWDALAPDVFATGNWEYVYGLYRYQQLFGTDADIRPIDPSEYGQMFMKPLDPSGNVYQGFNPDRAIKTDQNGEARRWRTIAANAYYNGENVGPGVNTKGAGELFTDPYYVKTVNGIRIGFIGCTTNRGPQVVSSNVTKGVTFTNCMGDVKFPQNKPIQWPAGHPNRDQDAETSVLNNDGKEDPAWGSTVGFKTVPEIVKFTEILRAPRGSNTRHINSATGEAWKGEGVQLVVLMSEAGIPESLWNAERTVMPAGVRFPEVILSSDTHERTRLPVVVTNKDGNKTVIIEEGEDGMQVGVLELEFENGKLDEWEWKRYDIDESIEEDSEIADLIRDAEAPFTSAAAGGDFVEGVTEFVNPFNGYTLTKPLDFQMASTNIILERNRFSFEHDPANLKMPADIEGTLHDVYADAFRVLMDADVGAIRGFRYNNTIMPGPVTIDDVYHSLTIGAMLASGIIPASPEAENRAGGVVVGTGTGKCPFDNPAMNKLDNKANKCHNMAWPRNLVQEMELSGNGTQQPNIPGWSGGWFFNYSGVKLDLDVYRGNFDKYGSKTSSRTFNARLDNGRLLKDVDNVSYASYYYFGDPNRVNRNQVVTAGNCGGSLAPTCPAMNAKIKILAKLGKEYGATMAWVTPAQFAARSAANQSIYPLDVVEAFGRYVAEGDITIRDLRSGTSVDVTVAGLGGSITHANFAPTFPRINLLNELPDGRDEFGFGVIQPMRGATTAASAIPADRPSDEGDF